MKSTSHFAMAHLIYDSLKKQRVYLNRTAFAYGNIAPDYIPSMVLTPHFGKVCTRNVEQLFRQLSEIPLDASVPVGAEYSKILGMICHYLCDYFCFAHNKDFIGGVKQHMSFENALDSYLRENWEQLLELDGFESLSSCHRITELMDALEGEKAGYVSNGYSFQSDLTCAFKACLAAIKVIIAMSQRVFRVSAISEYDSTIPPKGFATGNCYVFRMFFYKNRNNNIFFMPELMPPILA